MRLLRPSFPGCGMALVLAGLLSATQASATNYTWTGAGQGTNPRDWTEPTNWSPNGVPGAADTATISGGDLGYGITTQPGSITVMTLNLDVPANAVTLDGNITIPAGGTFNWTSGDINGSFHISAGATLNISGAGAKAMEFVTLDNDGTVVWTGGLIGGSNDAVFNNAGTFQANFDGTLGYSPNGGSNTATFNNTGTFIKTAGTGSVHFQDAWGLHNSALVNVQSGVVELNTGANSVHQLLPGSHFTGPGMVRIWEPRAASGGASGAAVELSTAVTLDSGSTLELGEASELTGSGSFTGPGTLVWSGGIISGNYAADSVTVASGTHFIITGAGKKSLDYDGTLNNQGSATWSGTGAIEVSGSTINNSGTFLAQSDALLTYNQSGTFNNSGTFTKEGSNGSTTIQDTFNNTGTVNVNSGTLLFDHAQYAPYVQTAGGTVLHGGTLTALEASSDNARQSISFEGGTLSGSGTVNADVTNGGTISPGGDGAAGTLTINGDFTQTASGKLNLELGGTNAGADFDQLRVTGASTLDGTLAVALLGTFAPGKDQSFRIMGFASHAGEFAHTQLPSAGEALTASYSGTSLTLTTAASAGGGTSSENKGGCAAVPGSDMALGAIAAAFALLRRQARAGSRRA